MLIALAMVGCGQDEPCDVPMLTPYSVDSVATRTSSPATPPHDIYIILDPTSSQDREILRRAVGKVYARAVDVAHADSPGAHMTAIFVTEDSRSGSPLLEENLAPQAELPVRAPAEPEPTGVTCKNSFGQSDANAAATANVSIWKTSEAVKSEVVAAATTVLGAELEAARRRWADDLDVLRRVSLGEGDRDQYQLPDPPASDWAGALFRASAAQAHAPGRRTLLIVGDLLETAHTGGYLQDVRFDDVNVIVLLYEPSNAPRVVQEFQWRFTAAGARTVTFYSPDAELPRGIFEENSK